MAFCISVRHVLQLEKRPTANSSITSATKISQKRLFGSLVHRKNLTNFLAIIPYNTCLACFHSLIRATANTKPSPPPRHPHLMVIGAGHSRSSKPFSMAGKQKRVGARSLENQPESVPKKSEAQPIGACHYAVQHSLSMPLGSTSMSSDSSLKKSRCKMREMFATTSVSKLLFATNRYTTDRLRPNCLANQPTDRPCRSSSSLMSCPMCIMLAYVIDMMA